MTKASYASLNDHLLVKFDMRKSKSFALISIVIYYILALFNVQFVFHC